MGGENGGREPRAGRREAGREGEREGPRDEAGGGWLGGGGGGSGSGSIRGSSRAPARSLSRGARRPPPGSGLPAAPAPGPALRRGSGSRGQDRDWPTEPRAGREAGRWLGGDGKDAEPRSAVGTGGRGLGVLIPGKGLCIPATNFTPAPWIPAALPGSGLRKPSLAREEVSAGRTPGVRAGCGAPRRGQARTPWPQSGRSARGEGKPERSGAARLSQGGRPPSSESGDSRPRAAPRRPGEPGSGRRACEARPGPPRWPAVRLAAAEPRAVPCALLLFGGAKRNVYPLPVFLIQSSRLFGEVRVDSPDVPPALGGDRSSRS